MESIYFPLGSHSNVTDKYIFSKAFKGFSETLLKIERPFHNGPIRKLLGVDKDKFLELQKSCNHNLAIKYKTSDKKSIPKEGFREGFRDYDIPERIQLESLKAVRERTPEQKIAIKRYIKYPGQVNLEIDSYNLDAYDLVPDRDILFTIQVFVPCKHRTRLMEGKVNVPKLSQQFLVPGRLTLDKLRDRIACKEDFQDISSDVSCDPLATSSMRSGDKYKSGLFYIGNEFYIDSRDKSNEDYSEVIKNWGREKGINFGSTKQMESTRFDQIEARLGYPYVYLHQGCCEHLIVIMDVRLLHQNDMKRSSDYPIMITFCTHRPKSCCICQTRPAKFIINNSERMIYDSAYVCTSCTLLYNFEGTNKVGNFKMYKYIDNVAIL